MKLSTILKELETQPKVMPDKEKLDDGIKVLQLKLLQIQQALYHKKERVIIIFEGFDASGKGGTIRALTEGLDPRSVRVVPIAAPKKIEHGKHWLYRFWKKLPAPGEIVVFDRSWYGRVLVEKVEKLTSPERLKDAHREINEFEAMLVNDGIILIKIFLAVSKDEQLERFKERLTNPYKNWKITEDDIEARKHWKKYVEAADAFFKSNNPKSSPWHIIPSNSKKFARLSALKVVTKELEFAEKWIKEAEISKDQKKLLKDLCKL